MNILITSVGGQGAITLAKIIAQAALYEKYDVKTSELHGLSQREGSVKVEVRFDKVVHSPLIEKGTADIIISLEEQEALNGLYFANKNTVFIINRHNVYIPDQNLDVEKELKKRTKNIHFVDTKDKIGNTPPGIALLGYGLNNGILPLKKKSIEKAIREIMPEKYQKSNLEYLNIDF